MNFPQTTHALQKLFFSFFFFRICILSLCMLSLWILARKDSSNNFTFHTECKVCSKTVIFSLLMVKWKTCWFFFFVFLKNFSISLLFSTVLLSTFWEYFQSFKEQNKNLSSRSHEETTWCGQRLFPNCFVDGNSFTTLVGCSKKVVEEEAEKFFFLCFYTL